MKPQKLTPAELASIDALDDKRLSLYAHWANKHFKCSHCGRCTLRCEVLRQPALDIGRVEEAYTRVMALPESERSEAVVQLASDDYPLYNALRRCCFCGYCTAKCGHHLLAADRMRDWRQLFSQANLMPPDDSKLVMVDNEWHIFSAYRAIYGIAYPEFISLAQAAEHGPGLVDTLFFPGCSLVSYAPDVMRAVGTWLTDSGISWALSDGCCGSPLMSAGLFERAHNLRESFISQMQAASITRMIVVCPGCGEEFAENMPDTIQIVPLPEVLLEAGCRRANEGDCSPATFAECAGFSPMDVTSLTFFDSCHDRFDNRHANAIRALMRTFVPAAIQREMDHRKRNTLCCGAGGAVASYDPTITDERVWYIIDEARATQAETLVTMCPTCTYTVGQALLTAPPERFINSHHYLEVLFGQSIPWNQVFAQLGDMWTGEYAAWLSSTFF